MQIGRPGAQDTFYRYNGPSEAAQTEGEGLGAGGVFDGEEGDNLTEDFIGEGAPPDFLLAVGSMSESAE